MKIKRVRIENFCCLYKVDVSFEDITSFIGPTGVGKSTVLRALDWFFNGEKGVALSDDDVHSAAEDGRISVEVEFDGLTDQDRQTLGRYAPDGAASVSIWRTWHNGEDKITGKALAYGPFEAVRKNEKAMELRRAYDQLKEGDPTLSLPPAGSKEKVLDAMLSWELANRDRLGEAEIEDTHFFGFAGQSRLAQLIDFVFVSADLRAYEEADDQKATALGRILDHAVDRSRANEQLGEIEESAHLARQEVHSKVYGPVLDEVSAALSAEVAKFTTGREVVVTPTVQVPKPARTTFQVSIRDGAAHTSVHRQGHGFQRALIIAALKYLADSRRPADGMRTLCLAIEEPELFQHPPQARTFAKVLRELVATSPQGRTQVTYATHNPVFIDPKGYHQIRRLCRAVGEEHPVTEVWQATEGDLCRALDGLVDKKVIRSRTEGTLGGALAEGFFAHAVVLVEGRGDEGVITGGADRSGINLGADGISVIEVSGKDNLMISDALFSTLGVPCHVVFDGDAGMEERKRDSVRLLIPEQRQEKEREFEKQARNNRTKNANLLRYLGAMPSPQPGDESTGRYTVFEDTLETYLSLNWPTWDERRRELVRAGEGVDGKNAATYLETTRTVTGEPRYRLRGLAMGLPAFGPGMT
ncbi:AAA family ATPase [Streptomyces sp. NBC_00151]|uniref:AAA family ATPase n=1 Tax=Streptomyces sp. NBC_00151 TaxID=2975669 RepID=UPI002DD87E3A|nr:AAA family ATPase [Streptomyces sp. NBC_00151]WRZ43840.1 ATP-dependent endonuclease [Streptomyces sp. NBC_00151]